MVPVLNVNVVGKFRAQRYYLVEVRATQSISHDDSSNVRCLDIQSEVLSLYGGECIAVRHILFQN